MTRLTKRAVMKGLGVLCLLPSILLLGGAVAAMAYVLIIVLAERLGSAEWWAGNWQPMTFFGSVLLAPIGVLLIEKANRA